MKYSIKAIFNNLFYLMLFLVITIIITVGIIFDYDNSLQKENRILELRNSATKITQLSKTNEMLSTLSLLEVETTKMQNLTKALRNLYDISILDKFITDKNIYSSNIDSILVLINRLNSQINEYLISTLNTQIKEIEITNTYKELISKIDTLTQELLNNIQTKYNILEKIIFTLSFLLIVLLWLFKNRTKMIYKDLTYLLNTDDNSYVASTQEVDAIALRILKKTPPTQNLSLMDQVTELNNIQGLHSSYAQKKGMRDSNFTSISIYSIDNFNSWEQQYSQNFKNIVYKKIASILKLHEQTADVSARISSNEFVLILSRRSKDQCYRDASGIIDDISNLKFNTEQGSSVKILLSGGFSIKPNNISLDDSLKEAKKLLNFSKTQGGGKLTQISDIAESEM